MVLSVCVCWYVTFLYSLCFWFYIIYNISANLCICVLDMPNVLHKVILQGGRPEEEQNQDPAEEVSVRHISCY